MKNFKGKEQITKEDVANRVKGKFQEYANAKFGKGKGGNKSGRKDKQINRGKRFNDVGYYTKNKSITEAFANLPFSWIVGNPIVNLQRDINLKIPAIVSYMIDWVANLNSSLDNDGSIQTGNEADIIDQVATIIYAQMRRSNSGSTNNIEHVDVLISNLIASIDICVNVHYIHRMFKVANTFSWRNRLIPNYIFKHHFNIDYDDFISNQANYRGEFNVIVAMARTIRTLADYPFINAIMDEFDNIFKDSDTDNGREQLILSVKPLHHIYDPKGTEGAPGGMVRLMTIGDLTDTGTPATNARVIWTGVHPVRSGIAYADSAPLKFSILLDILRAQINALINDTDFNLIQADIEKAFGEQSGYIVVDPVSSDNTITPVYSGEFNTMFKNGKFHLPAYQVEEQDNWNFRVSEYSFGCVGSVKAKAIVNTVYQSHDENAGTVKIKYMLGWAAAMGDFDTNVNTRLNLLNLEADDPSVDEVVIATRFKHIVNTMRGDYLITLGVPNDIVDADTRYIVPFACSNFVCWGGNVTYVDTTATGTSINLSKWSNTTFELPYLLLGLEHPPVYIDDSGVMYDNVNNIRGISDSELFPVQKACFLSLWNLPDKTNI